MSKNLTLYMIRDRHTGDFSPGGSYADNAWRNGCWRKKKGKVWNGIGPLKNHLRQFIGTDWKGGVRTETNNIPDAWEVLVIDVVQHESQRSGGLARDLIEVAA